MFGLSREKTVVDVRVSAEQQQEIYQQLVTQEMKRQRRIEEDQNRQAEQVILAREGVGP